MRVLRVMACLSAPILGIGLTGCIVGPDYQRQEVKEAPLRAALDSGSLPSRTVEGAVDIVWEKLPGRSVVLACRKTGDPKPRP